MNKQGKREGPGNARMKTRSARRGRGKAFTLPRLFALLGVLLALAALFMLGDYLVQANRLRKEQAALREAYRKGEAQTAPETPAPAVEMTALPAQAEASARPEGAAPAQNTPGAPQAGVWPGDRDAASDRFLPLLRRNSDVVGWLQYPMFSELDFAVVQRDNAYYMNHAVSGEKNLAGAVFLDMDNAIRPRDSNLILHGHNMKNASMFGRLARLNEPAIWKAEPFLTFDTLYQDSAYLPYAVTVFSVNPSSDRFFDVIAPNFDSAQAMGAYVNWLRARSMLVFPTEVSANDRLLTLVTCHGLDPDERLAVALRALRPGEDREALARQLGEGVRKP